MKNKIISVTSPLKRGSSLKSFQSILEVNLLDIVTIPNVKNVNVG